MKSLLREISIAFANSNQDDRKMSSYYGMMEHDGWKVHQEFLWLIRGKLAEEMLSERFTNLDQQEKDSRQRAYYYCDELVRFLLAPLERAQKVAKLRRNLQQGSNRTGSNPEER